MELSNFSQFRVHKSSEGTGCSKYLNMATSTISSCDSLTKLVPTRILNSILSFSLLSLSRE